MKEDDMKLKNFFYCFILLLFTVFFLVIGAATTIYAVQEFYASDGEYGNFYRIIIDPTDGYSEEWITNWSTIWGEKC
jgi:hypothetical protein